MHTGTRRVALATGLTLAYGATAPRFLPPAAQLPANLGAATGLVLLARHWERSWSDLGLDVRDAPRGVGMGVATVPPIAAALAAMAAVPALRGLFHDDRVVELSRDEATRTVLVRVPLETALAEELLFRGALLALALANDSTGAGGTPRRAVVWTALAFGAWHVVPALHSRRGNAGSARAAERFGGSAALVAGTIAATSLAGLGFSWLRLRSRSVVAPVIAHAALNACAFLATRRVARARARSA